MKKLREQMEPYAKLANSIANHQWDNGDDFVMECPLETGLRKHAKVREIERDAVSYTHLTLPTNREV